MFKWIDTLLNKVTMYRLVLYVLLSLLGIAFLLSLFNYLPYNPFGLLFSAIYITAACWIANKVGAKIFRAPTNVESVYITALILILIITPIKMPLDAAFFSLATWASIWAMASKYIFAIGNKHIFNPAAFAVALTALTINQSASWWIGTLFMMPFVFVGGLLIVKKIRRMDLMIGFFTVALISIIGFGLMRGAGPFTQITRALIETPILFFAFIMLTEPLTTPPTHSLRIWYGALVGALFAPWIHIGSLYSTPELALVAGNVFSYLVSPKQKLVLNVKEQMKIADHTSDFVFHPKQAVAYKPGQYMEWTLAHKRPDSRGNRRYFTLASSPTEKDLHLGVKFYPYGSSFKHTLSNITSSDTIIASQLAGDFVLPNNPKKKLVFIAGGIGITPFRSMIKYLIDKNEHRDVVLFYSNNTANEIAYADIFTEAQNRLKIRTIYALTDIKSIPTGWNEKIGFIDAKMIIAEVPDYIDRTFYLSGPHGMITAFDKMLKKMGIPSSHIKKDFFPGFV